MLENLIEPEDQQAILIIVGAMVLLAAGLWAIDKAGIKFAVGVSA